MKSGIKYTFGGLAVAVILGLIYIVNLGFYSRFFDIAWDEEVQLHDGRLILVHIKRTFERRDLSLERFPEHPRQVSMSFSFNLAKDIRFDHTFKRGTLHFLDEKEGKWYIGYHADGQDPSVEIGTRLLYPHIAILNSDGSFLKPLNWNEVPKEIINANILPSTPNPKVVSKFDGTRLTVSQKMAHWAKFPTGAGWGTINRITPQPIIQGEAK